MPNKTEKCILCGQQAQGVDVYNPPDMPGLVLTLACRACLALPGFGAFVEARYNRLKRRAGNA